MKYTIEKQGNIWYALCNGKIMCSGSDRAECQFIIKQTLAGAAALPMGDDSNHYVEQMIIANRRHAV